VFTREQQIQQVVDTDTIGLGVRALVNGTWGFAATRILTTDGVAAAAREAVAIAKASKVARDRAVEWLPSPVISDGVWKSAFTTDPFDISVEQKADLLLKANAAAMKAKGVQFVFSGFFFVKDERNYANTDGTNNMTWCAHGPPCRSPPCRPIARTSRIAPTWLTRRRGWEYILSSDSWATRLRGEEAVGNHCCRLTGSLRSGTDQPTCGSPFICYRAPTELDRAMGHRPTTLAQASLRRPRRCWGSSSTGRPS
jgi:TldD protein